MYKYPINLRWITDRMPIVSSDEEATQDYSPSTKGDSNKVTPSFKGKGK